MVKVGNYDGRNDAEDWGFLEGWLLGWFHWWQSCNPKPAWVGGLQYVTLESFH